MEIVELTIDKITIPNGWSRSRLCEQKISELANSIGEVGLLQPILVTEKNTNYILISGERRLKACQLIEKKTIPAIILSGDRPGRQIQIVENIQREDLNPIDRARIIEIFMKEENLTKVKASERLGVPRTTLTEWLNVLNINERFQDALLNNYYGGNSPLTVSHVNLGKRFAKKMGSDSLMEAALDAVLYYGLTRSETRKVLDLVVAAKDISITEAVRKVRLIPQSSKTHQPLENWHLDKLVGYLAQSGDYLVKTKVSHLQRLDGEQRFELIRYSRALQNLLNQVLFEMEGSENQKASS